MTPDQRFWDLLQLVECFYEGRDSSTIGRSVTAKYIGSQGSSAGSQDEKSLGALSKDIVVSSNVFIRKEDRKSAEPTGVNRIKDLQKIAIEIVGCKACKLCEKRANTVPGEGFSRPLVMVVGEGPGRDEDENGRPFVGMAGQYLDRWLSAIELDRNTNCFITNVVKCRPPNNRDPVSQEIDACLGFLNRQITILRPRVLLSLGRVASQVLTNQRKSMSSLRGGVFRYHIPGLPGDIPLVPTYHPSGVLRNMSLRRAVWDDLKVLKQLLAKSNANS